MEKEYTYSAFISYSSKDEKVAKALWKKLEHYRLPSVLQKQYEDIPEKMHVFLDQGDIVPGDTVENALSRELADSRKLIVICSPESAKSKYVQLEVKNFLALGHSRNDIIPYIIEGEVDKKSPNNCYVPGLYGRTDKDTINGVSLLRDGKWKAFVGVLANLIDVKFDEIYKREKVRKNRFIASVGFLGTIAACFLGIFIWYITPHTKCYNDYITKWGIPVGFGKARKQFGATYYEITYQFCKPIKLVHKNAWGFVTSHEVGTEQQNRPRIAEYHYNHLYFPSRNMKKWQLSYVDCYIDPNNAKNFDEQHMQIVYDWTEEKNANIRFYYDKERSVPKTLFNDVLTYQNIYYDDIPNLLHGVLVGEDAKDMPDIKVLLNSSNIYCHNIVYNEDGYETVITFYNYAGQLATDKNKIYGFIRAYNDNGQLIKEEYQYDGILVNQLYKIIDYDEQNEISKVAFYKQNKTVGVVEKPELILNKSRNYAYLKKEKSYDEKNRLLECKTSYYDEKEFEIEEAFNGIINECVIIDYANNEIKQKSLKKTGEEEFISSYEKEGDNFIGKFSLYNDGILQYNVIKKSNSEGQDFYYKFSFENPDDNYEINVFYEKTDDLGLSIKRVYSNNFTREAIYDRYGRHIQDSNIYADNSSVTVKLVYDGFNKHIYYYKDNKPYSDFTGFAQADFSYHSTGVLQNVVYRDENGKKTNHFFVFRFAEYDAVVTPHGLIRHQEFRDKNGNIVTSEYHKYAIFEGDSGSKDLFLTEGRYLLPDGSRALKADYCFEQCDYPYPESFDEPIKFVVRYYDQNNLTRRYRIFDALGKQKYTIIFSYDYNENIDIIINDSLGRVICGERRNKLGKHIKKEDKDYSIMKFTYLHTGERIVETIDETGFVTTKLYDDKYGNAVRMYNYNKDNTYSISNYKERETEHIWYNANNEIDTRAVIKYAEDGSFVRDIDNVREEINVIAYYDKNNCLKNTEEGWAKKRTEKNKFGNEVIYYYNDEDNFLPYISNCICYITEIDNDEQEFDIQIDDIVLQLGLFSFFNNSVFNFSLNSEADLDSNAIFYRPSTKQIIYYRYGDIPVITARVKQPCETIEKSEKYISDIKKTYEKWKKSNKSISD